MADEPALAVATQLQTAGVATMGTNLYTSFVREPVEGIPVKSIFVFASDGFLPSPYMRGITNRVSFQRIFVECYVRSEFFEFEAGRAFAKSAFRALHLARLPDYVWCKALRSEPRYIGQDKRENHEWNFRLELGIKETL